MLDAKLVVVGGDAKSGEVRLKLPTVIGRGKEAGLTVPHALVSRRHTEIFEREGRLYVRDLGSLNGTFVNNTKIESEQVLEPNQLLTLGNITFRAVYQIAADAKSAQQNGKPETIRFEEVKTETDHDGIANIAKASGHVKNRRTMEETVPVDSLSDISSISGLSDLISEDPAGSFETGNAPAASGKKRPAFRTTESNGSPDEAENPVDSDGPAIDIDLRSDIFTLDSERAHSSISASDIGDLDIEGKPASFVDEVNLGEHVPSPKAIESSVKIDLGDEKSADEDVDESRLGSFFKKLDN